MFEPVIDEFSLTLTGGGTGRILIPSKKSSKYIPELAVAVIGAVVEETFPTDQMMFCVYVKGASEVPQEALDAIRKTFADEKFDVQIGKSLDLYSTPV